MNPVTSCAALRCLPRSKEAGQIFVFVDNIWTHTDTPGEKPKKKEHFTTFGSGAAKRFPTEKTVGNIFFWECRGNAMKVENAAPLFFFWFRNK
jgi:hypothetical protein